MRRTRGLSTVVALTLLLAMAACAPITPTARPPTETATPEAVAVPSATPVPASPQAGDENAITTASGLKYIEIERGSGPLPQPGEVVAVHYRASLEDGTELDNSYDRNQPLTFALGQGQVIPGWDEGIALMHEGGKARLIIPPELAYGAEGAGGVIPPNATLIFEVELLSIRAGSPAAPTKVNEADYVTTASGLKYYDLQAGDGPLPQSGEVVSIEFTGWLTDGTKIGSSVDNGQPVVFALGQGQVIPGWDEGVASMHLGGKRQLVIPPALAFGEQGVSGLIPPGAILILEVELLSISPGSPTAPTKVDESDYVTTDSGLKYYDLQVGSGAVPQVGQTVSVHYTGWLTDGTKFDSSIDRGQPFQFAIGTGEVIPGWDEGVASMAVGGKRQLVIPAALAYGAEGAGSVIPANATLIFEVELLDVR